MLKDNPDTLKYLSLEKLEEIRTNNYTSYNRATKAQQEYYPETIDSLITLKIQNQIEEHENIDGEIFNPHY